MNIEVGASQGFMKIPPSICLVITRGVFFRANITNGCSMSHTVNCNMYEKVVHIDTENIYI